MNSNRYEPRFWRDLGYGLVGDGSGRWTTVAAVLLIVTFFVQGIAGLVLSIVCLFCVVVGMVQAHRELVTWRAKLARQAAQEARMDMAAQMDQMDMQVDGADFYPHTEGQDPADG